MFSFDPPENMMLETWSNGNIGKKRVKVISQILSFILTTLSIPTHD